MLHSTHTDIKIKEYIYKCNIILFLVNQVYLGMLHTSYAYNNIVLFCIFLPLKT